MLQAIKNKAIFYKAELKRLGMKRFMEIRVVKITDFFFYTYKKRVSFTKQFTFRNKIYRYSLAKYNYSWKNERTVEVPLIWEHIRKSSDKAILELGNVLSHYYFTTHDVLDKYEKGRNVINKDAATYQSRKRYDLIVSISTLEHIGWDEEKKDKLKTVTTINNLKKLLKPRGKMIITFPLGYNPYLDVLLKEKKLPFSSIYYLKRISSNNRWKQVRWHDVKNAQYNKPFPNANAIVVGIIKK